jgi:hypothetical protein
MKILALIATLLITSLAAQAEVVIYTQSFTDKTTGGGAVVSQKCTGWFVFDTDTYETLDIVVIGTTFREVWSNAELQLLSSGLNKFSLWALVPLADSGGASLKGNCTLMTIGTANLFWVPKTGTITGAAFTNKGGANVDILDEFTGTLKLDSKSTIAANVAGQSFSTTIATLENILLLKGFTKLP